MTRDEIALRILEAGIASGDQDATPDMMIQVSVRLADMLIDELNRTGMERAAREAEVRGQVLEALGL